MNGIKPDDEIVIRRHPLRRHAGALLNLNPAMGGADVAQRRRDAKGCALVRSHLVGECLLVCICFFFAPLRLCATSIAGFRLNSHLRKNDTNVRRAGWLPKLAHRSEAGGSGLRNATWSRPRCAEPWPAETGSRKTERLPVLRGFASLGARTGVGSHPNIHQ